MADITIQGLVGQSVPRAESDGIKADLKLNRRGELCVVDFYTQMALEGRAFQVRIGTISTPAVGDVVITDTKAEMCVDAATGTTVLPTHLHIGVNLGTGTLHEYACKSVAAVAPSPPSTSTVRNPRPPPPIFGPANVYVQVAATGTGPSYYSSFEFIELPT